MKGESVCAHLLFFLFFLERLDIDLVITACGAHSLVFEWTVQFNLSSAPASEVSMDILINMEKETIPCIYQGIPLIYQKPQWGKTSPWKRSVKSTAHSYWLFSRNCLCLSQRVSCRSACALSYSVSICSETECCACYTTEGLKQDLRRLQNEVMTVVVFDNLAVCIPWHSDP